MKKILKFIFFISILSFVPISFAQNNSNDTLEILSPIPNQVINSPIAVTWKMFDSDQNSIKYSAKILDRIDCGKTDFGNINEVTTGISSLDLENKIDWDGKSTSKFSNLPDGKYCLKICGLFVNNSNEYSLCKSQEIRIIFTNQPPVITSNIPSVREIDAGSFWEHTVTARDSDNDQLSFRLVRFPPFLEISDTGKIRTRSGIWTIPVGVSKVEYTVEVAVSDGLNNEVTQNFELVVNKNENGNENSESLINIISPDSSSLFSGSENIVKFEASDPDGIQKIFLEYSTNSLNWIELVSIEPKEDSNEYSLNWDTTQLQAGEYFLRIGVLDRENVLVSKSSSKFSIQNSTKGGSISLSNFKPARGSILLFAPTEIEFDILTSENTDFDPESLIVRVNNQIITKNCQIIGNKVVCNIENLDKGLQNVEIEIRDFEDGIAKDSWTFEISAEENTNSGNINFLGINLSSSALVILLIICVAAFLLLIVPWLLLSTWRNRARSKKDNHISDEYISDDFANSDNQTPYDYSIPNITTNVYSPQDLEKESEHTFDYSSLSKLTQDQESIAQPEIEFENDQKSQLSDDEFEKLYPELSQKNQESKSADEFIEPKQND